jgi:hypothetical protein
VLSNNSIEDGDRLLAWVQCRHYCRFYAERFVRSIKDECLNRMIFIGQASLRRAVAEYMDHYHRERNHQGLENRLIHAPAVVAANEGAIYRHARLGGTLNFYYRQAA